MPRQHAEIAQDTGLGVVRRHLEHGARDALHRRDEGVSPQGRLTGHAQLEVVGEELLERLCVSSANRVEHRLLDLE